MKIIALDAENVKRLKAVHIEPSGALVIIGGRNAQGKTSVLDSIMYALAGKKKLPKKALRDGQDHGYVMLHLDDGLIVTRSFTEGGGGELRVESKGAIFRSPQAMLDKLVGRLGFDPMEFDSMDPAKRLETLKNLVGLDFRELDSRRQKLYEDRKQVARDRKATEGTIAGLERSAEAPEQEISVADLTEKLTRASQVYREAEDCERRAHDLEARAPDIERHIRRKEDEMGALETEIDVLGADLMRIPEKAEVARKQARDLRESCDNPGVIRQQLQDSQAINAQVRVNQELDALDELLGRKKTEQENLTGAINKVDALKQDLLAQAKFPVEGLSFGEGDVLFGGQPWEQCAESERIQVSVGMGFAMNPELRVLLIRQGSGLDQENLALVADLAEKAKGQLFIERVGDQDESAIIIEDGMVIREPAREDEDQDAKESGDEAGGAGGAVV